MGIRVRATKKGLYGRVIRQEGDEFTIRDESQLGRWMERLDGKGPAKRQSTEKDAPKRPPQVSRGPGQKHVLERIKGVGEETRNALMAAGVTDLHQFAEVAKGDPDRLVGLPQITAENLPGMLEQVRLMLEKENG
jgi:hypothetical protein